MDTKKRNIDFEHLAQDLTKIELPRGLKCFISAYCEETMTAEELAQEVIVAASYLSLIEKRKLLDGIEQYIKAYVVLTETDPQAYIDNVMLAIAYSPTDKIKLKDMTELQRKRVMDHLSKE